MNPRTCCQVSGFRDRPVRPLRHLSTEMAHNVTPEGVFRKTQKAPKNGSSSCATCHRNCPVKVEKGDTSESVQDVELDCWWLNLPSSVGECVALYRGHGASEQFYSERKSATLASSNSPVVAWPLSHSTACASSGTRPSPRRRANGSRSVCACDPSCFGHQKSAATSQGMPIGFCSNSIDIFPYLDAIRRVEALCLQGSEHRGPSFLLSPHAVQREDCACMIRNCLGNKVNTTS